MEIDLKKIKKKKSVKELLEFGIINIDKSSGPTSFNVSDYVKQELGLRKTSHFGTLDPKVTGVLPVALNRACKLTGFFIGEDKEYVGIMRFHEDVDLKKVEKTIKEKFTGVITQLPPVKSRVKRQEREREIKSFKIIEKEDKDFLFKVDCEGGTYIRKLVHDLGEELRVGAHMLELRRVRAGIFSEQEESDFGPAINLFDFNKAVEEYKKGDEKLLKGMIIPGEVISELFPVVEVKEKYLDKIMHGSPIFESYLKKPEKINGKLCIFSKDKFVGVYKTSEEKGIFARPEFVLQPLD